MDLPAAIRKSFDDAATTLQAFVASENGLANVERFAAAAGGVLQKGGKLTVMASTLQGQPYVSGIPLDGYTKAMKGKPMDVKAYKAKAKTVSDTIMKRRANLQKKIADAKMVWPR